MSQFPERGITIKTATILKVLSIAGVLVLLWLIRGVLALLCVALFLAALMHPAARWGERRKIPKGVTVIVIYLFLFGLMAASLALLVPVLAQQSGSLTKNIGSSLGVITEAINQLHDFSIRYGIGSNLEAGVVPLEGQLRNISEGLLDSLTGVFGGFIDFVVVLVMAFYMVVQEKEAVRLFRDLVPDPYQEFIAQLLGQVEEKMGQWLSAQLLLSFIIGLLYYVGLLIIGVDSPLPLALFGAFTEFIPYLGPILGGIPIVLVAWGDSSLKGIIALALVILIQQLENNIIVPKVMERRMGLNPLLSIVAVLVGAKLFGVVGALLSIPVATALSLVLTEVYRYHRAQLDAVE